jgi:hypothetical protein
MELFFNAYGWLVSTLCEPFTIENGFICTRSETGKFTVDFTAQWRILLDELLRARGPRKGATHVCLEKGMVGMCKTFPTP